MVEKIKLSLDVKLTDDELEAFYDHSSARTSAIVLSAIVENHLTATLIALMVPDPPLTRELFQPSGPIGPFGTKIRLAYLLRIISKDIFTDLTIVSKIRNKFAHDLSVKSFDNQQVSDWIKTMPTRQAVSVKWWKSSARHHPTS